MLLYIKEHPKMSKGIITTLDARGLENLCGQICTYVMIQNPISGLNWVDPQMNKLLGKVEQLLFVSDRTTIVLPDNELERLQQHFSILLTSQPARFESDPNPWE